MKRKKEQKKFDLPERGFEHQISVIFPPTTRIFMEDNVGWQAFEGEGEKIKSRRES